MQKMINEFERLNGLLKNLDTKEVLYKVLNAEREALRAKIKLMHKQGVRP